MFCGNFPIFCLLKFSSKAKNRDHFPTKQIFVEYFQTKENFGGHLPTKHVFLCGNLPTKHDFVEIFQQGKLVWIFSK